MPPPEELRTSLSREGSLESRFRQRVGGLRWPPLLWMILEEAPRCVCRCSTRTSVPHATEPSLTKCYNLLSAEALGLGYPIQEY